MVHIKENLAFGKFMRKRGIKIEQSFMIVENRKATIAEASEVVALMSKSVRTFSCFSQWLKILTIKRSKN